MIFKNVIGDYHIVKKLTIYVLQLNYLMKGEDSQCQN
jgi:hypothetical protein